MKLFKVVRTLPVQQYLAYVKANDWEEAEEKARYDDSIEWEDINYSEGYDDYEAEEIEDYDEEED